MSIPEETRLRIAQIAILVLACNWGIDYLLDPPKKALYAAEQTVTLPPIGALLFAFGIMGLIGELWMFIGRSKDPETAWRTFLCRSENRWWPSWFAHSVLCAIYLGFFVWCIIEMLVNSHIHGMRVATAMLTLAAGHWVFAQRRKHAS